MKKTPHSAAGPDMHPSGGKGRRGAKRVQVREAKVGTAKRGWIRYKISKSAVYPLVNVSRKGVQFLFPAPLSAPQSEQPAFI